MLPRILIVLAIIVGIGSTFVFRVYEQERAILFQLGKIVRADFNPGLHFKLPLIQIPF